MARLYREHVLGEKPVEGIVLDQLDRSGSEGCSRTAGRRARHGGLDYASSDTRLRRQNRKPGFVPGFLLLGTTGLGDRSDMGGGWAVVESGYEHDSRNSETAEQRGA